ncbi:3-oxoacyl-[acyl-carrier-protein] synthase III C-terminal domain-containing protein [Mesorhizobium sp. WSM2561]|uniref:3-oxoacyl-[acyl-carrier-protein] synthase III C-terminal domain-containing protein n=1 Tax=Mesorhizobium sp. WSM2561 TaxID=1040985 RepID=UPI001FD8C97E|nr:3-oxoacyl-[acyl-carrier-protein] synthase III C-terminal domain-containing protein [Mesorhizobium sp. WSM2561]
MRPEVARFLPHQANARIFNAVSKSLGIEDEHIIKTIADYATRQPRRSPCRSSHGANPFRAGEKLLLEQIRLIPGHIRLLRNNATIPRR